MNEHAKRLELDKILAACASHAVLEAGKEPGLLSMDDAVFELYMKSRITAETAVAFACSPDEMKEKIRLF